MKRPYVVYKDITLARAAKLMSDRGIGSLVFIKGSKVQGIITHTDLLRNFGRRANISEVLTKEVVIIEADEDIENAAEIMREHKIKHLPVVENGDLVGIVTASDIAAHSDDLEEEFFFN